MFKSLRDRNDQAKKDQMIAIFNQFSDKLPSLRGKRIDDLVFDDLGNVTGVISDDNFVKLTRKELLSVEKMTVVESLKPNSSKK